MRESTASAIGESIRDLRHQVKDLDKAIAALELIFRGQAKAKLSTRGRKSMGAKERLEVSARMKASWEGRKKRGAG
jgi:hypothetical protein